VHSDLSDQLITVNGLDVNEVEVGVVEGFDLEGRGVWNSGVGFGGQVVLMVDQVLGPCLPLLLSSDSVLWCFGLGFLLRLFELDSRLVWDSSVGLHSEVVLVVDEVLGPCLPLLLASWCLDFSVNLDSGLIWDSGICLHGEVVLMVDEVLGPCLPLLLASWCFNFGLDELTSGRLLLVESSGSIVWSS